MGTRVISNKKDCSRHRRNNRIDRSEYPRIHIDDSEY
jgi:hypothetical protein